MLTSTCPRLRNLLTLLLTLLLTHAALQVVEWTSQYLNDAVFINYEQVHPRAVPQPLNLSSTPLPLG